jgi:hypothetical protein
MVAQGLTPPDADAAIHAIALRFGTSRAMSELLGCAAREHEAWSQTLRQGHAQVLRVSEEAMRLSLKGDPAGTVVQLLADAERLCNAKLAESAHQVLQRHGERIADREALQLRVDTLRSTWRLQPLRLGDQIGHGAGAVPLPGGLAAPDKADLPDAMFTA